MIMVRSCIRKFYIIGPLTLFILVIILFSQSLAYPFLNWDDLPNIVENSLLKLSWQNLYEIWTKPYYNLYIPLTYTSWSFLCWVGTSCEPEFFHAWSIILHLANTLLVFILARDFLKSVNIESNWALFSAALFAVHPIQVETVVWISGSRDLLSVFWALMSWKAYWSLRDHPTKGWISRKFFLPVLFFTFSLLSKPGTLVLPVSLILFDLLIYRIKNYKKIFQRTWLLLAT